MPEPAASESAGRNGNEFRLFLASFLTLIAAGIGFSVRGGILGAWSAAFGFTQSELGQVAGFGLVGFGFTIIFFSFFADRVGYGPLMVIAFLLHFFSVVVTLVATPVFHAMGREWCLACLSLGGLLFSLANGTCEAVINPLTATLYPRNKTHWLNILHAGWPGGLVLGGLIILFFDYANRQKQFGTIPWEVYIGMYLIPTILYGVLMFGQKFPHSETRVAGLKVLEMLRELGTLGASVVIILLSIWMADIFPKLGVHPAIAWMIGAVLLVWFGSFTSFAIGHWMMAFLLVLHAMVGYVELGTDSWIQNITERILGSKAAATAAFIWANVLMFSLRFFAGPIVHKISPLGLLFATSVIGAGGLYVLGSTEGAVVCMVAYTVYALGKTFFWPTMLGVVSERFPRGGALTLGAIGGVGMLSAGILGGPGIGYKQDYFAKTNLEEKSPAAYERYKSEEERAFLKFPKIAGLDGTKVATLNKKGENIQEDIKALQASGRTLSDDKNLQKLSDWWDDAAKHQEEDLAPVNDAGLYGGQMALKWTSLVPAMMAVGYLILILYIQTKGGYRAEVLVGHAADDEKFTGGVQGPVE